MRRCPHADDIAYRDWDLPIDEKKEEKRMHETAKRNRERKLKEEKEKTKKKAT